MALTACADRTEAYVEAAETISGVVLDLVLAEPLTESCTGGYIRYG